MPEYEDNLTQPGWRGPVETRTLPRRDQSLPPNPFPDEILATETLVTARKTFGLSWRRNRGGEFLRIDETRSTYGGGQKHNAIIIPADALTDFRTVLDRLMAVAAA